MSSTWYQSLTKLTGISRTGNLSSLDPCIPGQVSDVWVSHETAIKMTELPTSTNRKVKDTI